MALTAPPRAHLGRSFPGPLLAGLGAWHVCCPCHPDLGVLGKPLWAGPCFVVVARAVCLVEVVGVTVFTQSSLT